MPKATEQEVRCYHCGDPCRTDHVVADGKDFCCVGCKAVYGLLQESGLCDYYTIADTPGVKQGPSEEEVRPELLDLKEVRDRLVEFSEDGITRVRFFVPQVHCSSCIWLLENLGRIHPAVLRSRMRFANKELTVTFREDALSLRGLVELMRRIGYAPQLQGASQKGRITGASRSFYLKLGISAFAFGNIMLFSFPEYLGVDGQDALLRRGFQWLGLLFALPVIFYAATDFFRSAWAGIRQRHINIDVPIALGIMALFSRSVIDVVFQVGPGYFDSLAGLVFFLLVGRWYQAHVYEALSFDRTLEDLLPIVVLKRDERGECPVRVADLVPGDVIVVRDHELVPVDAELLEGDAHIDNSFITGEPLPLHRTRGAAIPAGGRQRGGAITLRVRKPFSESHVKRMWEEQGALRDERPAMPRMIDAVAQRFTWGVLLVALAAGLFWWGRDSEQVWPVITAVLIVACPCALALSMPFAFGHAMRLLGRKGLFLRDVEVVERMAGIDTVVFDKTGTLTDRDAFAVEFDGGSITATEERMVRALAGHSAHPLSAAVYQRSRGKDLPVRDVQEVPGAGIEGEVMGVPVRLGSASFVGANSPLHHADGQAEVYVRIAERVLGRFLVARPARSAMAGTVGAIASGHHVHLLTGDRSVDREVSVAFAPDEIHMEQSPTMKATFIERLRTRGRHVMMVGDGLNDAGAMRHSEVGIAVSGSTTALTPACDGILEARALDRLPWAMRLSRRAHRIVIASLVISLVYNTVGILFAVSGELTPLVAAILMPLSSVTVVAFVSLAVWVGSQGVMRTPHDDRQVRL
ncbi:MAG: heavy metal translocating P-type ATPase metal-binding domain-containing protein [Flavobacteriales bacterium]|nr:heavy metal translocating P-type ATPase metal-binding domain-containing protein [Flavobacteriales bacterium]MCB9167426.1 heavy metal translocating P-type ATPase metal-binding domain-containing protein [Flavobacteriales bacterium]MCB9171029.1 heavy metal translocating P-type ATPase metal-binding domain-containing protein [Flavobacteriales bacterium]